ncbi:MAG: Small heat shock protein [uncultured bacterium]|nr:MAG: Small heat shock protein [uncultured bacterium]HBR71178.1 heat-shock protein Hsp20 [Candidatus Moranbacteria bacterium]
MLKTKRSFMERMTGAKSLNDREEKSMPIYNEEETEIITGSNSFSNSFNKNIMEEETYSSDAEGQLTIDVYQTENDIIIKSTIAGVKPEDLDVTINNDMVIIKGERKNEEKITADNYYYQECYWGGFSRSVVLPVEIISDKAEASLKNGILTIKLPKADTTKSKKIQVRGF